jgi:hypothetical protein
MIDKPSPLSPAHCDLRGYDFMPLFGHRMFRSKWYSLALKNPRAGLASQKLWWEAWQQCPAGSLPKDDEELARLADFGLDLKTWAKVKDVALHGFIECNDGRLYHPVLCQEATVAFEKRVKERERKAQQRAKKWTTPPVPPDVPRDRQGTDRGPNEGHPQTVRVDRTETGQDRTKHAPPDPLMASVTPDRESGEPTVNGWRLNPIGEQCLEAAGIDPARWRGDFRPVIAWLRDGFAGNEIAPIIAKRASAPGYSPPFSLQWFDQTVRQNCPMDATRQRA